MSRLVSTGLAAFLLNGWGLAAAQPPASPAGIAEPTTATASAEREAGPAASAWAGQIAPAEFARLKAFLEELLREQIPKRRVFDKDWGHQKRIYAGFRFRREGLRIETERRWNEVDHGRWRWYAVTLLDPEDTLVVKLSELRWRADGGLHLRLRIFADGRVKARQQHWSYGIRLYSAHVQARVRLQIDLTARVQLLPLVHELPPALQLLPEVESAELQMASFQIEEIGHLGGDISEALGDAAETLVRKEIVARQSEKLANRLNRQLTKKRDELKLSLSDWLLELLRNR
jgi:hypothetical protein